MNTILVLAVAVVALLLVRRLVRRMATSLKERLGTERQIVKLAEKVRQLIGEIAESNAKAFFARNKSAYPTSEAVSAILSQTPEVMAKHQALENLTFPIENSGRPKWYEFERWSDIVSWKVVAFLRLKAISAKFAGPKLPAVERQWRDLVGLMEAHLSKLDAVPEMIARENHVVSLREKHESWLRDAYEWGREVNRRIKLSEATLGFVKDEISHFKSGKHSHPANNSSVVKLPGLIAAWEERVRFLDLISLDPARVDEKQAGVEKLAEDVRIANIAAFALLELEKMANLTYSLIAEIKEKYRFIDVQDSVTEVVSRIFKKQIPEHWRKCEWEALEADFNAIRGQIKGFTVIVYAFCKAHGASIPVDLYEKLEVLVPELPSNFFRMVDDAVIREDTADVSEPASGRPTTSSILGAMLQAEKNFRRKQEGEAPVIRSWGSTEK